MGLSDVHISRQTINLQNLHSTLSQPHTFTTSTSSLLRASFWNSRQRLRAKEGCQAGQWQWDTGLPPLFSQGNFNPGSGQLPSMLLISFYPFCLEMRTRWLLLTCGGVGCFFFILFLSWTNFFYFLIFQEFSRRFSASPKWLFNRIFVFRKINLFS